MRHQHDEDVTAADQRPRRWFSPGAVGMALLALGFALVAAGVVGERLRARHAGELRAFFALEQAEIAMRIEERFRAYRQVLRGARAFFEVTGDPSRRDWAAYVAWLRIEEDYPGIQGIGFAVRLPAESLERHVLEMRAVGFPYYRVWPGGERERYSAVTMIEPFSWRNQRAFGFDMYSEPVRRAAMERAMQTGRGALSGKVRLVQETERDRQAGVLMYLPVYMPGEPADNAALRSDTLVGWVFSAFRMDDLMQGLLGVYSAAVRLRIYDGVEDSESLLYDSHATKVPRVQADIVGRHRIEVDGRDWMLVAEALPGFASAFDIRQTELVATGAVGLLLVVVTWSFWSTRERARTLAAMGESLRRSEARYSTLVNLAHEGIAAADRELRLSFANPRLGELLGSEPGGLVGRRLDEFCAENASQEDREDILRRIREGQGGRYEVELVRSDGAQWTALVSSAPLKDADGRLRGTILMVADISQRKEAERRAQHLATHDPLTGVPNRLMFADLLAQAVEQARRYEHRCALLFVDLDRFKAVNDAYGHAVGDRLLREAVDRMERSVRTTDTLGRQGGDEFLVLLPEVDSGDDAEVVAEKIRKALDAPFVVDGLQLGISSSIGIALFPDHGEDDEALLKCADEAMYCAKTEGRNRVCRYGAQPDAGTDAPLRH